jgi:hypothetical protein
VDVRANVDVSKVQPLADIEARTHYEHCRKAAMTGAMSGCYKRLTAGRDTIGQKARMC